MLTNSRSPASPLRLVDLYQDPSRFALPVSAHPPSHDGIDRSSTHPPMDYFRNIYGERTSQNSVITKFSLPHHPDPESLACEGPQYRWVLSVPYVCQAMNPRHST